jgi:hypothetical protein
MDGAVDDVRSMVGGPAEASAGPGVRVSVRSVTAAPGSDPSTPPIVGRRPAA